MPAWELVDASATGPAVVLGSLPPGGRDLDVAAAETSPIAEALRAAGYVTRGHGEWARFAAGDVDLVDLLAGWPHLDEILAEAELLPGCRRLARPAPHHALLVLAQQLAATGAYPAKRVPRMEAARGGAQRARALAAAWGVADELERVLSGAPVERRPRVRPRRPRVVALSGIDGAGKSTQARLLAAALEQLGYDVEIVWQPLGASSALDAVVAPLKRALHLLPSLRPPAASVDTGLVPNVGTVLRQRSGLAHRAWTTVIATANGLAHARAALAAAAAGRVLVFDRYVLDSRVRLRFLYGDGRAYRVQDQVVRRLSPRPRAAFVLDVSPAESLARKDDRWSPGDLERLVRLYDELDDGDGVHLAGTRAADDLAAEIAQAVWLRLG